VNAWLVLGAAVLLTLERACYVWVWRDPDAFRELCAKVAVALEEALEHGRGLLIDGVPGGVFVPDRPSRPVDALRYLFYGFKVLQLAVFIGWCYVYGNGSIWPPDGGAWPLVIGGVLAALGQVLNISVFYQLRTIGVFYGNKFGYHVSWCCRFPFTLFDHPQYVGTLLSIWGFFLIMRFPHDDWIVLPALETAYYAIGAHLEQ
jgi:hypothetical protein